MVDELEAIYSGTARSPIMDVTKYVILAKHLQVNPDKSPSIRWFGSPSAAMPRAYRIQRRESARSC